MAQEKMFKAALEAIDQGQTTRARDLFTRLLRSDSSKAEYWLWMSTLVDTNQERIYCLESALRVDPGNEAAKRGLIILGARQADKDITPAPLIRRHWEKELENIVEPPKSFLQRLWDHRIFRFASIAAAILMVIVIILVSRNIYQPEAEPVVVYKVSPFPSRTPEPTLSPTATRTLVVRSPTPTFFGPTPLWMFLPETYTPVPLYVNTPHPVVEAYRVGIQSFERSDWNTAIQYLQQAIKTDPDSPDYYYYIGESYRMLGRYDDAVLAYGQALEINPIFAPAYYGRALAYEKINPKSDIEGELSYAIEYDPSFVDAYIARARIRIKHHNPQGALDDIALADQLFPGHPMVYVLLAQANLQFNDPVTALQNALLGFELDKTSLYAYLTLSNAYLANNDLQQAINYIDIYLIYVPNDADGWAIKAQAEYQIGNFDQAIQACNQGITSDPENAPSWYYCGLVHLEQGDTRSAVNELVNAVNLDMMNFDYSIALGKALWADDRLSMAIRQFNNAETLAATDNQRATVYYYRGQVYEQSLSMSKALEDWRLLLALPPDAFPVDWRIYAQEHLEIIIPPTPTETPIPTSTPTSTPTPGRTPSSLKPID